jgi:hypothetical protein
MFQDRPCARPRTRLSHSIVGTALCLLGRSAPLCADSAPPGLVARSLPGCSAPRRQPLCDEALDALDHALPVRLRPARQAVRHIGEQRQVDVAAGSVI